MATKVAFFFHLHKLYLYNQKKSSNFAGNLVTMRQLIFTLLTLAIILIACETPTTITTSDENRVQTFTFYEDTLNPGLTQATYKIEHRTYSQEHPDTGLIYCKDSLKFDTI